MCKKDKQINKDKQSNKDKRINKRSRKRSRKNKENNGNKKIRNEFWNLIEILELATPISTPVLYEAKNIHENVP